MAAYASASPFYVPTGTRVSGPLFVKASKDVPPPPPQTPPPPPPSNTTVAVATGGVDSLCFGPEAPPSNPPFSSFLPLYDQDPIVAQNRRYNPNNKPENRFEHEERKWKAFLSQIRARWPDVTIVPYVVPAHEVPLISVRDFTKEERETCNKIVVESDGFDCPYVPLEISIPGMLKPVPVEDMSKEELKGLEDMADLAIKYYNDQNGMLYQFVKVIKANTRWDMGSTNNITFQAKDDASGSPPRNFQARVTKFLDDTKVLFCRVEQVSKPSGARHAPYPSQQQEEEEHGEGEEMPTKRPHSSGVPPSPKVTRIPFLEFTKVEREIYNKIVDDSDGFDCPYVPPGRAVPGLLKPVQVEGIPDVALDEHTQRMKERLKGLEDMADLALKHYNDQNDTSYEFVKVIKANARCNTNNITFQTKDDTTGSPPQNFQARVTRFLHITEVLFCRVEQVSKPPGGAEETSE